MKSLKRRLVILVLPIFLITLILPLVSSTLHGAEPARKDDPFFSGVYWDEKTGTAPAKIPASRVTRAVAKSNQPPTSPTLELPEPSQPSSACCPPSVPLTGTDTSPLWENLSFIGGLDGSKGPEDLGINAHMGMRLAANLSVPLLKEAGVGLQLGSSINYHQNAVAFLELVEGTVERTQNFTTVGLFQRSEGGWRWAVAHDFLYEQYYRGFFLGQWRGLLGFAPGEDDEVGTWGTVGDTEVEAAVAGRSFELRPINQANFYWRHVWPNEAVTRGWVGVAAEHSRFVVLLPDRPAIQHPVVFGADIYVPLNNSFALFGEANFITPNDSGTVTAFFGVAFYPGGGAVAASRRVGAPMLPVANNPSFGVDARR